VHEAVLAGFAHDWVCALLAHYYHPRALVNLCNQVSWVQNQDFASYLHPLFSELEVVIVIFVGIFLLKKENLF
jgi:hypothetical protein